MQHNTLQLLIKILNITFVFSKFRSLTRTIASVNAMRLKWYLAFQIPPRLGTQTTANASAERKPRGVPQDLSMTAKIPASEFHKDPIPISLLA